MVKLIPFRGLRPNQTQLPDVIAPPYDVVDTQQAKEMATHPFNYLYLTKPEITSTDDESLPEVGARQLQRFLQAHVLETDPTAGFYLYQMRSQYGIKTGIAALVSLDAKNRDKLLVHEQTRPDKQRLRSELIAAQNAQLSPVMLTYREQPELIKLMHEVASTPALVQASCQGVEYRLWPMMASDTIARVQDLFAEVDHLYIADGHHRSAAAIAQATIPAREVLFAVCFPASELTCLAYHRLCRVTSMSLDELKQRLAQSFELRVVDQPVHPTKSNEFGCFLDGQWLQLQCEPKAGLPVELLHQTLIEPLLDIHQPRTDPRIDFIGGDNVASRIEEAVNRGEWDVGFTLFPTTVAEIMELSEHQQSMPPKSTWFEPKLADGLVAYQYEE